MIPREPILGEDWSTIKHFETILSRVDLPLGDIIPTIGNIDGVPKAFGAKILFPEKYFQSSFSVYVSEFGWLTPKVADDLVLVNNDKPLTRRLNRVMIKAREKGSKRTAVRSWMLVNN